MCSQSAVRGVSNHEGEGPVFQSVCEFGGRAFQIVESLLLG